jgi:DNA-binding beta-propeller fold protein YncE
VDSLQNVYVTDPEAGRVLEFDRTGAFIRAWGQASQTSAGIGLAAGVAVDAQGSVWVTDASNNLLLHFTLPAP